MRLKRWRRTVKSLASLHKYATQVARIIFESHPALLSCTVLLAVISGLGVPVTIWMSQYVVDSAVHLLDAPQAPGGLRHLVWALLLQTAIALATGLLADVSAISGRRFSQRMLLNIRHRVFRKLHEIDFADVESPEGQDRVYRAQMQSPGAMQDLLNEVLSLVGAVTGIGASLAGIITVSPMLAVLAIVIAVPGLLLSFAVARLSVDITRGRAQRQRKTAFLEQVLTKRLFVRESKLLGLAGHFSRQWRDLSVATMDEDLSLELRARVAGIITRGMGLLAGGAAYAYVAFVVAQQAGTIGTVVMVMGLYVTVGSRLGNLAQAATTIYRSSLLLRDYFEFMAIEPTIRAPFDGTVVASRGAVRSIEFDNVTYRYAGSSHDALSHASFRIDDGQCVFLVGENGAGKSTLINLLLHLYACASGSIRLNGQPIEEIPPAVLAGYFAPLVQDFASYDLSLRDNITVGRLDAQADAQRLLAAVRIAKLDDVIEQLPRGLDTCIGKSFEEGAELSAGQWQRIGIARALYRNAPVFVLDEPTNFLDPQMQASLFEMFLRPEKGRIVIIASHNLHWAQFADIVIVLKAGRVVEMGSPEVLLTKNGAFAEASRIFRKDRSRARNLADSVVE